MTGEVALRVQVRRTYSSSRRASSAPFEFGDGFLGSSVAPPREQTGVGDPDLKHVSWAVQPNSVGFQCILLTPAMKIASPTRRS